MGDVKWTSEQKSAIDIRNSKTLVAAGAGSGKTAVLVERIIRKVIDDKVDIDKMLVVTFTKAAASEMKERIRKRLYAEVAMNHSLQKQILYLNRSSITTIDSFCTKAVKDYFYKLDIDPNSKIVDPAESELLKLESLDEVLEECYETTDKDIIGLLDAFSNKKGNTKNSFGKKDITELILSIHNFIQSCPKPFEWLDEKCEMYNVEGTDDFAKTDWGKIIVDYALDKVDNLIAILNEFRDIEKELLDYQEAKSYLAVVQDDILRIEEILEVKDTWDDFYNLYSRLSFKRLTRADKMDEGLKNRVKELREKMKNTVDKDFTDKAFSASSKELLNDLKQMFSYALGLKKIIYKFDEVFKKKKLDKNLLEFSDISHLCLKLFEDNEDVLQDFKNKYEEILIDEYQDSNLVQEAILNKIAKGNIFMVGDVKQSIYRFRQASPELFMNKYKTYSDYTLEDGINPSSSENLIRLFKNFRSNENIIDQINFIFKNIMYEETGEIEYTEEEYLKIGATCYDFKGENAEFHMIEKKKPKAEGTPDEKSEEEDENAEEDEEFEDDIDEKAQLEARVVAKRINEIVGKTIVYDKELNINREVKYSDITILLRSPKGSAAIFKEELESINIPVYVDIKLGYFDNTEVQVFLSLLKIIDNPYQDIPLLAVLKSPIGGFNVNELTKIRLFDKKVSFYDAVLLAASGGDEKARHFIDNLSDWRQKSRYMAIDEFISYLYDDTNYYYYVSLLPNGDVRQNNLKILLKKAADFGKTSFKGLYNFLTFIDNVKLTQGDMDAPSQISDTANVVRIMSIHKSKGLEFPVVFLCGTSKKFNEKDLDQSIITHHEKGLAFDIVNTTLRVQYESVPKLALAIQNRKESLAEEMRILYVAMTRAREKLIVTALVDKIESAEKKWEDGLTKLSVSSAKTFADWIGSVVLSKDKIKGGWKLLKWSYDEAMTCISKMDSKEESLEDVVSEDDTISSKEESELISIMDSRFNWKYEYALSTKIPSKLSVSELKRLYNLAEPSLIQKVRTMETPKFIEENAMVGASYGTLLHSKMERLDYNEDEVLFDILLGDVEEGSTKERLKADILNFTQSSLYKYIKESKKICREVPFNLSVSAKDIFKFEDDSKDDTIMVQGIIDLYYETEEGIVIVDYKSDRLNCADDFIERYAKQLEYYKKALESITGKKVLCSYIYSFNLKESIRVS